MSLEMPDGTTVFVDANCQFIAISEGCLFGVALGCLCYHRQRFSKY
jgi:hypothetical protein